MTLPQQYEFTTEIRWYLGSYRAYSDVWFALEAYPTEGMTYSRWKVYWAGVCSLLKSSIHLFRVDASSCVPGPLKSALGEAYHELSRRKVDFPLFWDFINRERNNILKEYSFSAYEVFLKPDGTTQGYQTFFDTELTQQLVIRGGAYDGRLALELAKEATSWVGEYVLGAISDAGLDPNERVNSTQFLRRQAGETDPVAAAPTASEVPLWFLPRGDASPAPTEERSVDPDEQSDD
jgi:hypothetical protein